MAVPWLPHTTESSCVSPILKQIKPGEGVSLPPPHLQSSEAVGECQEQPQREQGPVSHENLASSQLRRAQRQSGSPASTGDGLSLEDILRS